MHGKEFMKRILLVLITSGIFAGCGSSGSSSPEPEEQIVQNISPVALAGDDFSVEEQALVNLTGSGSDSDGSVTSYQWSQVSGPTVSIDNAESASASFSAPMTTSQLSLEFELTVTDNQQASASDRVTVTVIPVNLSPQVSANSYPGVIETQDVSLSVQAEDEDGEIVAYLWQQVGGTDIGLSEDDMTSESISFSAPKVEVGESLSFAVIVTDNENATASVEVSIEVYDSLGVPAFNRLNDTGQTLCGNYTLASDPDEVHANDLDCNLTESPEGYPVPDGQDGHYGLDQKQQDDLDGLAGMRFLKLDQQGDILPAESEEWACVIDQNTGLTWEVKTEGPDITAAYNRFTWYSSDMQTNGGQVGTLNDDVSCAYEGKLCHIQNYWLGQSGLKVCGSDDWRMPTPKELFSLVSMKPGIQAKIDNNYFPNINAGNAIFWTATSYSLDPERAFVVDFSQARILPASKSNLNGALIVRSTPQE